MDIKCFQLIPLVAIIGVGGVLAGGIIWRLATQSPDVTWNRSGNPEPWEKYRNKQYKVYIQIQMIKHAFKSYAIQFTIQCNDNFYYFYFQLYSPNIDYSKLECPAPDYRKGVESSK